MRIWLSVVFAGKPSTDTPKLRRSFLGSHQSLLGRARWIIAFFLTAGQVFGDERTAWRYKQGENIITMVRGDDGNWRPRRPDGRTFVYEEIERNDQYIEIRKPDTQFQLRLYAGKSQFRKNDDEAWRAYWKGDWVRENQADANGLTEPMSASASEGDPPAQHSHEVRIGYFVPSDRQPVANYEAKARVAVGFVTSFYRTDLNAKRLNSDGFKLQSRDGAPIIHLIRGKRPASFYNHAPAFDADVQWKRLAPEILDALGPRNESVSLVFADTQIRGKNASDWPGNLARGAYFSADGGRAVIGAVCLRDEYCATTIPAQMRLLTGMSPEFRQITMQRYGALAHELGHAFGLPHDRRRDDVYMMGNGFRKLHLNLRRQGHVHFSLENSLLLMSSRFIARDLDLSDNTPPQVTLQLQPQGPAVRADVTLSDDAGLRAVSFIDRTRGSMVAARQLVGKKQVFSQLLPVTTADATVEIQITVTDHGGNRTQATETLQMRR